jgi:hypothetical protein
MRVARLTGSAFVVSGAIAIASCSGGTVASTPIAAPTATSAPVTQAIPATGGALNLATSTSQVASVAIGAGAPAGVTLTASSSDTAPSNVPVISSLARTSQAKTLAITGAIPFFYVTFSVSANFSTQFLSSETVSLLPSNPTTATYGVAFDDITTASGTELGVAGPGTIANGIVTFANLTSANAPTLVPGHTYLMQFFYVPSSASASPIAPTIASPLAPTSASPSAPTIASPSAPTSAPTIASPSASPIASPSGSPIAPTSASPSATP